MSEKNYYKIFLTAICFCLISTSISSAIIIKLDADDWIFETVDDTDDDFWHNSIDIDNNNKAHICYYKWSSNPNNEKILYAYKTDNNWNIEIINDDPYSGACCDITTDSDNKPHVCYQGGYSGLGLIYSYKENDVWMSEEVHDYGVSSYTSIDVDSNDNPHIAFYDCVEDALKYAYKNNDQWNIETVDSIDDGDGVGKYASIIVDNLDRPHISYHDTVNYDLKYAYKNNDQWNIETVDTEDCGYFSSISIDSNNNPHISYRRSSVLKYATKNTGSWDIEIVDDSYDQPVIYQTSIKVDMDDDPHICYHHGDAYNRLKYAKKTDDTWNLEVIKNEVDQYCTIGTDQNNNPHISYTDNGFLKYCYIEGDTPDNNPPTAYIDDITPNPSEEGEMVSFSGHGTDSDGSIIGYNWRSSIDGQLSTDQSFTKSDLTTGTHTIYFKVKDDDNSWSSEKTETLIVGEEDDDPEDLPSWSIGNKWIYNFNFNFLFSGVFEINGAISPMELKVEEIDLENDEYILKITGNLDSNLKLFGIIPGGSYTGSIEGIVHIDKSTLGMKNFKFESDGTYAGFGTHAIATMTFDPAFDIFDFPIEESEDEDNPWDADTYSELCIDFYVGSIHINECVEGGFEDEEIHFVKNEFHNGYNCKLISGNMGPSHGGSSKLWYSSDAGYLVDIQESIYGWEGVDGTLNMPLIYTNYDQSNNPPNEPDTPSGETTIIAGDEYSFTAVTDDEEDDEIYYMFDWGDSFRSEWLGPYSSGESVSSEHTWLKAGSYNLRVKAKDEHDLESKWSDPLVINVQSENPITTILIHRFDKIDDIDYPYIWDPTAYLAEWYYRVEVESEDGTVSTDFYYCTEDGTQYSNWGHGDGWIPDREHDLICTSPEVVVTIKAMDHDDWYEFGDDLWDISGCNGDGPDNDISDDNRGAIYHGTYDLITDSFKPYSSKPNDKSDYIKLNSDGYYVSSGEFKPDKSDDYDGNDAKVEFFVSDTYYKPTAEIVDPKEEIRVSESIDFIGSVSDGYSTDEKPYEWNWDFGDGSSSTNQNPTHSYSEFGTYTIILTVTDAFDQTSSDSHTINVVANQKPEKPNPPTGSNKGKKGKYYTFSCVTSDPEEDDIWYKFDWDDGTYSNWIGTYKSGEPASLQHSWDKRGTYNVRVKAKDEFDLETEWSNPAPIQMNKYSDNLLIQMFERIIDMYPFTRDILQPIIDIIEANIDNTQPNPS